MSVLIPLAAILAFVVGAVVWKVHDNAGHRGPARDETLRAGRAAGGDGEAAAGRAEGSFAWARMSDPAGP